MGQIQYASQSALVTNLATDHPIKLHTILPCIEDPGAQIHYLIHI